MFDLDAITRRAQAAKEKALADLHQSLENLEKQTETLAPAPEQPDEPAAAPEPSPAPQVEILGQTFGRKRWPGWPPTRRSCSRWWIKR